MEIRERVVLPTQVFKNVYSVHVRVRYARDMDRHGLTRYRSESTGLDSHAIGSFPIYRTGDLPACLETLDNKTACAAANMVL